MKKGMVKKGTKREKAFKVLDKNPQMDYTEFSKYLKMSRNHFYQYKYFYRMGEKKKNPNKLSIKMPSSAKAKKDVFKLKVCYNFAIPCKGIEKNSKELIKNVVMKIANTFKHKVYSISEDQENIIVNLTK